MDFDDEEMHILKARDSKYNETWIVRVENRHAGPSVIAMNIHHENINSNSILKTD